MEWTVSSIYCHWAVQKYSKDDRLNCRHGKNYAKPCEKEGCPIRLEVIHSPAEEDVEPVIVSRGDNCWEKVRRENKQQHFDCPIHGIQEGPDCPRC